MVDWYLTPPLAVFQLYHCVNKCYINLRPLEIKHIIQRIIIFFFSEDNYQLTIDLYF